MLSHKFEQTQSWPSSFCMLANKQALMVEIQIYFYLLIAQVKCRNDIIEMKSVHLLHQSNVTAAKIYNCFKDINSLKMYIFNEPTVVGISQRCSTVCWGDLNSHRQQGGKNTSRQHFPQSGKKSCSYWQGKAVTLQHCWIWILLYKILLYTGKNKIKNRLKVVLWLCCFHKPVWAGWLNSLACPAIVSVFD